MKDKTLLILAAGMGSRYGGLKQTEKFGPNGEYIIDYSIFDAIEAGFNKVVFVIKEENYDLFRETVGKRVESHIKVEYVFQNLDNVDKKYEIPAERVKPLGTAHAILCAKDKIHEEFAIINADDFYGRDAFMVASKFMDNNDKDIAIVGYKVKNTLTENGAVKRGLLKLNNGMLSEIVESNIEIKDGDIEATPLDGGDTIKISEDDLVSMNMIVFPANFFEYIEKNFDEFLSNSDLLKAEYLIPNVVSKALKENYLNVYIEMTNAKWVGVTYKEDKDGVANYINELISNKVYKEDLWS